MEKRVALVAGGSEGIGKQTLAEFAQQGYDLVCFGRSIDKMEKIRDEMEAGGANYLAVVADVTDEEQVRAGMNAAIDRYGRVDVLVCCAGGSMGVKTPVDKLDPEFFDQIIQFNLRSCFLLCKYALPTMKQQQYGRIVVVGSGAGRGRSLQGSAAYVAAKAGAMGFTRHISKDLGVYNITINCVAVGLVITDRVKAYWYGQRTPEERADFLSTTPIGRPGEPHDMSRVITFLSSEDAGYITGAVFDVNGGHWVG